MSKSKELDLIFVGPQAAGKTTLFQVLQGNEAPQRHEATASNGESQTVRTMSKSGVFDRINPFKVFTGNVFGGKVSILDAGGKMSEFNHYMEWCRKAEKIIIVFNGIELLDEVENCEEGGETTSFCRMLLSQLHEIDASNLYFIATHADWYSGGGGMCDEIQKRIKHANERYAALFNSKRYPMFGDMLGRLYEVNATDSASVQNVFSSILSQ